MIAFTSDIDWAPEEVISDMLKLFEQHNIKCTLFSTHDSEIIKNCNKDLFEIAIHPNFNNIIFQKESTTPSQILDELIKIYPEAKGVRSHSLTQSGPILNLFKEKGLVYESNQFVPYGILEPYELWNDLIRIPFHWEDDVHYLYDRKYKNIGLEIFRKETVVLNFHPIQVFINSDCENTYLIAKKFYHKPLELKHHKNKDEYGTRDLLESILSQINENSSDTFKLSELVKITKKKT